MCSVACINHFKLFHGFRVDSETSGMNVKKQCCNQTVFLDTGITVWAPKLRAFKLMKGNWEKISFILISGYKIFITIVYKHRDRFKFSVSLLLLLLFVFVFFFKKQSKLFPCHVSVCFYFWTGVLWAFFILTSFLSIFRIKAISSRNI